MEYVSIDLIESAIYKSRRIVSDNRRNLHKKAVCLEMSTPKIQWPRFWKRSCPTQEQAAAKIEKKSRLGLNKNDCAWKNHGEKTLLMASILEFMIKFVTHGDVLLDDEQLDFVVYFSTQTVAKKVA